MRTKLRLYAAVFGIVALGVLVSGTAVASAHGDGKRTLRIEASQIQFEVVDLGTEGTSLGDEFVLSEALSVRGREVGTSGVVCTVTEFTPPYEVTTYHCVGTLSLRRGQITLQGLIELQGLDDPGPFTVAITGGTGAFRGAGGEAVVREMAASAVYKLHFDSRKDSHKKHHHGR